MPLIYPVAFMSNATTVPSYRYLRLNLTAGAFSFYAITQIRWLAGAAEYPTSNMTSNTAPSPLVVTASSEATAAYLAYSGGTIIGETSNRWQSVGVTENIKLDLGAGNAIPVTAVKMVAWVTDPRYPTAFSVQCSNDDSVYTTLASYSGLTTGWTADTYRTFTF